jgi:hypothetical protein
MSFSPMENYFQTAGSPEQVSPKREQEVNREKLDGLLDSLAGEVNRDLGEDILDAKGCVKMDCWKVKEGGIYSKEEVKTDKKMVDGKQLMWSGAESASVMKHYREKYGWREMPDQEVSAKILDRWQADREKSKPALLESVVTVIFHKLLKSRFAVMRSSTYDDYENGVDNIIINKETGQVICAFDEVHGENKHGGEGRKEEKIIKKAKSGGTKIKYGLTFAGGRPVKKTIAGVPIFYLALEPEDLNKVLSEISGNLGDRPAASELAIFDRFAASLGEQAEMLSGENLPFQVAGNIADFKRTLEEMKNIRNSQG